MQLNEFMQGLVELDERFANDSKSAQLFQYLAVWLATRQPEAFEEVTDEFFKNEAVIDVMKTAYDSTKSFEASLKDLL